MKLIDFLDLFCSDNIARIRVWHEDDADEPCYEGMLSETPYWLMNTILDTRDDGAVEVANYTNEYGVKTGIVIVFVRD